MLSRDEILRGIRRNYDEILISLQATSSVVKNGQDALDKVLGLKEIGPDYPSNLPVPLNVSDLDGRDTAISLEADLGDLSTSQIPIGLPVIEPVMRIRTLGKFQITLNNKLVDPWNNNRAKSILKLLIIHPDSLLPQEFFVEALWPNQTVEAAKNSLRVSIYELRNKLKINETSVQSPQWIIGGSGGYSIDLSQHVWVDSLQFEALWDVARIHEANGEYSMAFKSFRKGIELYKGDFLDEDRYEEWSLIRRERLLDIYLSMLDRLADYCYGMKDFTGCIQYSQKLLEKDKCQELAYQKIIKACLETGQKTRALRWYEICKDILYSELDCDVSDDTFNLVRSISKVA